MKEDAIKEWNEWNDEQKEAAMAKILGWKASAAPAVTADGNIELDEDCTFPAMPTITATKAKKIAHREKIGQMPVYSALVARPVTRTEMESTEKGREAIGK